MISQSELIKISAISKAKLHGFMQGKSIYEALQFRRGLQEALAKYAKGKRFDEVQSAIIGIIAQIESWARQAYSYRRLQELLRTDSSLLKKGKAIAKAIIATEWEAQLKRLSY